MGFFKGVEQALLSSVRMYIRKGESRDVVLMGEAVGFKVHWATDTTIRCSGPGCGRCPDDKIKTNCAMQVAVLGPGGFGVWALEGPATLFAQIFALEKQGDLKDKLLRLSRSNDSGKAATYTAEIVRDLADGEQEQISRFTTIDVAKLYGVGKTGAEANGDIFEEEK